MGEVCHEITPKLRASGSRRSASSSSRPRWRRGGSGERLAEGTRHSLRILDARDGRLPRLRRQRRRDDRAPAREQARITLMFCAFAGPPKIVRLHGRGDAIEPADAGVRGAARELPGGARRARDHPWSSDRARRRLCGYARCRSTAYEGERHRHGRAGPRRRAPTGLVRYQRDEERREHRRAAGPALGRRGERVSTVAAVLFDLDGTAHRSQARASPARSSTRCASAACRCRTQTRSRPASARRSSSRSASASGSRPTTRVRAVADYREYFRAPRHVSRTRCTRHSQAARCGSARAASRLALATKPTVYAGRILAHSGWRRTSSAVVGSFLDGRRVREARARRRRARAARRRAAQSGRFWSATDVHDIAGARANGIAAIGVGYGSTARATEPGGCGARAGRRVSRRSWGCLLSSSFSSSCSSSFSRSSRRLLHLFAARA